MSPTVSIIVPVYNAENTIRRCVDSILNQEYTDFELILVNDGSKDLSGAICDEYAAQDSRVKVIHKENSGVSDSRNLALDMAKGTYLQFLDADDWITPNATRLFVEAASDGEVPPSFLERRPARRRKRVVYTVTFNPSLDYIVSVKDFALGKTNRTSYEQMLAGGKGINVSTVLKNLDVPNVALGFTAGFTGKEIVRMARKSGLRCNFITLEDGLSRINVKMRDFEGTEINGIGPVISKEAVEKLMEQLKKLRAGDILVLAGSIPESMDNSIYREIMSELSEKGIEFVVDATKDLLLNVLEYHPFLIKPNNHELGEIFGVELTTREEVVPYAKKLQEMGARNVLVSMAGEGAVLLGEKQQIFMLPAPKGKVVNAVGAGDSMVAGFLAGWMENQDSYHAFKMGVAAGSASAFSESFATKEEIQRVYDSIV